MLNKLEISELVFYCKICKDKTLGAYDKDIKKMRCFRCVENEIRKEG